MDLGNDEPDLRVLLLQPFGHNRNHRVFGAKMIRVNEIQTQLGSPLELVILDIGGNVGVAAQARGVFDVIRSGTAHNGKFLYRTAGIAITQAVGMEYVFTP